MKVMILTEDLNDTHIHIDKTKHFIKNYVSGNNKMFFLLQDLTCPITKYQQTEVS